MKEGNVETLMATDVGYYYGAVYTSMSGSFKKKNKQGLGNLLLYSLGYYLKQLGFKHWDMGM